MNPTILLDHEPTSDPARHVVRALLRVDGTAPDRGARVPLNLSVVLDCSGSMSGAKLHHAKQAAEQLLARVHPEDTTSVVSFASDVVVVAPAAKRGSQTQLGSEIARIVTRGMTNLSGGWLEGRAQVERFKAEQSSNRIVLMTDGLANQGITDSDQLARLFGQARAHGVTTSTIGFGQDFDEALLERLADAGGGNAHYIEHPDQAEVVFRSELDELLALSAQNLTVELRLEGGVELVAVHHSYPRETTGRGIRLRLGDLYASEPKQLLIELGARASGPDSVPLASVLLAGDVLTPEGGIERREISLPVSFSPAVGPVVDPEVRRTLVFLEAAAARREALEDERQNRFEAGAAKLRRAAASILSVADDDRGREEAQDLELMANMLSSGAFGAAERKYMSHRDYKLSRSKMSTADLLSRSRRESGEHDEGPQRPSR
ncbi:MAG TPA: VWA domain-containing protein [Longimicrobiales bacterium]|nr:VWA domain-containing protein [Longimicrobiales bacterium]